MKTICVNYDNSIVEQCVEDKLFDAIMQKGYVEGFQDGYAKGYKDSHEGRPYNDEGINNA